MFDETTEVYAFIVCFIGLVVFTVAIGIAAGFRRQAEDRARLAAEREHLGDRRNQPPYRAPGS
jgi:hypothetical protein